MKKIVSLAVVLVMTISLGLVGCGKSDEKNGSQSGDKVASNGLKVVTLINGNLGDKSFFDSAAEGMKIAKEKLGYETKVIEMGFDKTKWEPTLQDVSDEDWDLIIVGTWEMMEYLERVATQYPDKKYIIFDTGMDFSKGNLKNIYSIEYKQNEASFLAGVLGGKFTTSGMEGTNADKKIGFLGAMDSPIINDFLAGYIQGAKHVDKDMKVAISYVGNFEDSAKGKEMSLAQYNQGVDIGFNVAGQAGLGQLDAAKELKKYVIGVDSDQYALFAESDPEKASLITTSVLKRVDNSLVRALELFKDDKLEFGKGEVLGLEEQAVEIAENENYNKLISEELRKELADIKAKIISGEIKVESSIGMDKAGLDALKESAK
ncbi:MAG: BMP family ABC transporter substrate-binding protein [Clostridium sp.]